MKKVADTKTTIKKKTPENTQGIQKWIKEYRDRFAADTDELEERARQYLASNEYKTKGKSTTDSHFNGGDDNDDDGWVVVSRTLKKTRQRMVPSTDKTLNRLRAKHTRSNEKKELENFYKFQMTDKKVDQLEQLKMKFELDKQRIVQMRQQRKFKPF